MHNERRKKLKKTLKLFIVFFLMIILICPICNALFMHTAETDKEALNQIGFYDVNKIIFKYETESSEILFCQDETLHTYECILTKQSMFGKTNYKNKISWTSGLRTRFGAWEKVSKNLKYAVLDDEEDIKYFDYEDAVLKKYEFSYLAANGTTYNEFVYIIDETGEEFEVVTYFHTPK